MSADLADPLRFKQVWRTHVSERKRLVAAARGEPTMGTFQYLLLTFQSNVMYKQCEVVITYVLQTVCTMISTRTIIFTEATDDGSVKESFTKTCNESIGNYPGLERTNAVLICLLTWVVMLTFMPLLLAAFAHSIGPAPPISKEKLKVRALPLARFVAPPLTESRGSLISGGEGKNQREIEEAEKYAKLTRLEKLKYTCEHMKPRFMSKSKNDDEAAAAGAPDAESAEPAIGGARGRRSPRPGPAGSDYLVGRAHQDGCDPRRACDRR